MPYSVKQWTKQEAVKSFRTNIAPFTITGIIFHLGYIDARDRLMIGERFWRNAESRKKLRDQVRILKQELELIKKGVEVTKDRAITALYRGR
jgi:hypothetical protein